MKQLLLLALTLTSTTIAFAGDHSEHSRRSEFVLCGISVPADRVYIADGRAEDAAQTEAIFEANAEDGNTVSCRIGGGKVFVVIGKGRIRTAAAIVKE